MWFEQGDDIFEGGDAIPLLIFLHLHHDQLCSLLECISLNTCHQEEFLFIRQTELLRILLKQLFELLNLRVGDWNVRLGLVDDLGRLGRPFDFLIFLLFVAGNLILFILLLSLLVGVRGTGGVGR